MPPAQTSLHGRLHQETAARAIVPVPCTRTIHRIQVDGERLTFLDHPPYSIELENALDASPSCGCAQALKILQTTHYLQPVIGYPAPIVALVFRWLAPQMIALAARGLQVDVRIGIAGINDLRFPETECQRAQYADTTLEYIRCALGWNGTVLLDHLEFGWTVFPGRIRNAAIHYQDDGRATSLYGEDLRCTACAVTARTPEAMAEHVSRRGVHDTVVLTAFLDALHPRGLVYGHEEKNLRGGPPALIRRRALAVRHPDDIPPKP